MPQHAARRLLLFLSDGLSQSDLKCAFRHLVLQLPDESWRGGSRVAWEATRQMRSRSNFEALALGGFREPDLFHGLKALVISDACYLKRFEPEGDRWPCEDFKPTLTGMGFDSSMVNSVSIIDLVLDGKSDRSELEEGLRNLSSRSERRSAVDSTTPAAIVAHGRALKWGPLLDGVSVVAVNGGDPDFVTFVLTRVVPHLTEKIHARVDSGSLIFVGRSAGAMVGGADVGLTTEPTPGLTESLLGCDMGGCEKNMTALGLAGLCAIRPHYTQGTWDIASEVYERVEGLNVVRMPNGEGMMCSQGACRMVGWEHQCIYDSSHKDKPPTCTVPKDIVPHREGKEAHTLQRLPCPSCARKSEAQLSRRAYAWSSTLVVVMLFLCSA